MKNINHSTNLASHFFDLVIGKILTSRLSLSKHLAHNLGNLLLLGKIGVFHNRRNASSRLLLLISKQLTRNGRSASLQRTFKKAFTSFSHSTRNKTRDGLIRVRNIRALNGRFNTSITHAYSIVIGSKHITLNATGGGFLTASKQFRHGATSKSRSNTASN